MKLGEASKKFFRYFSVPITENLITEPMTDDVLKLNDDDMVKAIGELKWNAAPVPADFPAHEL